jgi:4-hydroxy-tetrahydrodipicolinate reductase
MVFNFIGDFGESVTKIGLVGASGKLGKAILEEEKKRNKNNFTHLIARSKIGEINPLLNQPYTDFSSLIGIDLLIEVASPVITIPCIDYCKKNKIPLIIGSTGHTKEQLKQIEEAAGYIPLFFSQNFSLSLSIFFKMLEAIKPYIDDSCYVDLIEKHRASKKDAPSGTAKKIAERLNMAYNLGGIDLPRDPKAIQIHPIRAQDHVIEHLLQFGFLNEAIEIKHQVYERNAYAKGVSLAIDFIKKQPIGLYQMEDLLTNKKGTIL